MAREPDNDKYKPAPVKSETGAPSKADLMTEQEKSAAEKPSQLEPYPTGKPQPARDYFGRPVNAQGQPLDADGKVIPEPVPPKEEKK